MALVVWCIVCFSLVDVQNLKMVASIVCKAKFIGFRVLTRKYK